MAFASAGLVTSGAIDGSVIQFTSVNLSPYWRLGVAAWSLAFAAVRAIVGWLRAHARVAWLPRGPEAAVR
jgi:hypothetical protein